MSNLKSDYEIIYSLVAPLFYKACEANPDVIEWDKIGTPTGPPTYRTSFRFTSFAIRMGRKYFIEFGDDNESMEVYSIVCVNCADKIVRDKTTSLGIFL